MPCSIVSPACISCGMHSMTSHHTCHTVMYCACFGCNRERKRGLEMSVSRTPQQEAEENAILEQAATIQAARKAEQAQIQAQRKAAAPPPAGATCFALLSATRISQHHLSRWFRPWSFGTIQPDYIALFSSLDSSYMLQAKIQSGITVFIYKP